MIQHDTLDGKGDPMTCDHGQATVDEKRFSISIRERESWESRQSSVWTRCSLLRASQTLAKTIQAIDVMPGSYVKGNVL